MWIIQYAKADSDEWCNLSVKIYTVLASAKSYVESKRKRHGVEHKYRLVECKVLED